MGYLKDGLKRIPIVDRLFDHRTKDEYQTLLQRERELDLWRNKYSRLSLHQKKSHLSQNQSGNEKASGDLLSLHLL
jgi:hypothetical protein